MWNLSIASNILAYPMLIQTRMLAWGLVLELSVLGLLASVILVVRAFGVFSVRVQSDRSLPFIRAAWACRLAALVLSGSDDQACSHCSVLFPRVSGASALGFRLPLETHAIDDLHSMAFDADEFFGPESREISGNYFAHRPQS